MQLRDGTDPSYFHNLLPRFGVAGTCFQAPLAQGLPSPALSALRSAATCAPHHGQQSREVIALSAAGQLDMGRSWADSADRRQTRPCYGELHPSCQTADHDVVHVGTWEAVRAGVVLEGGDHPVLGLDRREPGQARALHELQYCVVRRPGV